MDDQLYKTVVTLFGEYDTNSDGYLSRGEFVAFSREVLGLMGRGESNNVFKESDLNADDKISLSEFILLIQQL